MAEYGRYGLAAKLTKKALGLPAGFGSRVVSWPPVRSRLDVSYDAWQRNHRLQIPSLPMQDAAIVDGLRTRGVVVSDLSTLDLPNTAAMLSAGLRLADKYRALESSGVIKNSFQAPSVDVFGNRQIVLWGLNERLLRIAETYFELPVGYDCINFFYTKADGRQHAARKWHRDSEDRKMLKVAIYLNDVDIDGGPFEVLHADMPQDDARSHSFSDNDIRERLGAEAASDVTTCVGPTGTVIFADTARFYHRGRPAVGRSRCAIYFNYFSRTPVRPFRCERSTLSRRQIRMLAEDELTVHQRDCLLWRDALPLIARIIPPAPVW